MNAWHTACSSLRQHSKRLASRGGRNSTSTVVPVSGVRSKKGACTSPLFILSIRYFLTFISLRSVATTDLLKENPTSTFVFPSFHDFSGCNKSERPSGGTAARAWGMEVQSEASYDLPADLLRSRAAERHTGANRPQPCLVLRKPQLTPDYNSEFALRPCDRR
jgi:hypothetical protein